jgi:hypothetical protein
MAIDPIKLIAEVAETIKTHDRTHRSWVINMFVRRCKGFEMDPDGNVVGPCPGAWIEVLSNGRELLSCCTTHMDEDSLMKGRCVFSGLTKEEVKAQWTQANQSQSSQSQP